MKVTLVATVKDAVSHVGGFLDSVRAQTRAPDEVVIADGGSTDGTLDVLRAARDVTLIERPGANIAGGRNAAIAAAAHDVIALSDADCVLEPDWLERLLEPIEGGADVSMGFYRPIGDGFLQRCMAAVNLPDVDRVDPDAFMPSGRSMAFRRQAYEAAGGFPGWLDIGEDMYLDHRFRELGLDMRFAPGAVAGWRPRPTLGSTWTQYFRYARGDAIAEMHAERHALRFAVYGATAYAWASRSVALKALTFVAAAVYAAEPLGRVARRFGGTGARARAAATVLGLIGFTDAAKMTGYAAGLLAHSRRAEGHGASRNPLLQSD